MQIVGPMPIGPVAPVSSNLDIKPLQRVIADIVQVNGNQVVLSIDGVPVVADVLSSELAAELKGRPSAQFLVSQGEDGKTNLRLVPQQPGFPGQPAESGQQLSLQLLREYGLPVNAQTQTAAQAAINQRLALQPGQLEQLMRALSSQPGWGAREANLAAAILSAGLPLTPQSLELAARSPGQINASFAGLLAQLESAQQDPTLPAETRDLIRGVAQALQESVLDAALPARLPRQLAEAVTLLGRPVENVLAEEARLAATAGQSPAAQPGADTPRGETARQLGLLQSALQDAALPAGLKDLLRAVSQALQQAPAEPGQPPAPQGQLATPQGQSAQVQSQPALPQGQPAALQGQPAEAQGQPAVFQGQPATPQGQPVESQGQPAALQGQLAAPQGQPAEAQGQTAAPQGQAVQAPGQPAAQAPVDPAALAAELIARFAGEMPAGARAGPPLTQPAAGHIEQLLAGLENSKLPAEMKEALSTLYQALLPAPDGQPRDLPQALRLLGRALAGMPAEEAAGPRETVPAGLAAMASLQHEAGRAGKPELAKVLDEFMQDLSRAQWQNIPSNSPNPREDWVEASLWMRLPTPEQRAENIPIRLRVDRPPEGGGRKIDAAHAHIVVQVELPDHQVFQVNVGLNQREVKADVAVPDEILRALAHAELPTLAESLEEMGYHLGPSQVQVGAAERFAKVEVLPDRDFNLSGVNLEA